MTVSLVKRPRVSLVKRPRAESATRATVVTERIVCGITVTRAVRDIEPVAS